MNQWYKHIIGARTIKTGLAFLTTLFCLLLNLTLYLLILTAIVSIEPTAKASLRKGYRRLPATVIGALFAVIFTYIFGVDLHLPLVLFYYFSVYKIKSPSWYNCCSINFSCYDTWYS